MNIKKNKKVMKWCTNKQWEHCEKEKRGCNGCYYNERRIKMNRVKIISGSFYHEIEDKVNAFIYDKDIKQISMSETRNKISCLILYEKEKQNEI